MAETYKKQLLTVVITMNNKDTFTVADTVDCPIASQALSSLKTGRAVTVFVSDGGTEDEFVIFPGGVSHINITRSESEEIPIPDPSC